jgi:hypothetical protein
MTERCLPICDGSSPGPCRPIALTRKWQQAVSNKLCVTRAEAAAALGVTMWTLDAWIREGLIPVIRFPSSKHGGELSRRVLIAATDLEKFVSEHRT